MTKMTEARIAELLVPYIGSAAVPQNFYAQLCQYLDLLTYWGARTNLTAIRDPHEAVLRHFGESLFLGRHLPAGHTLLDYGSGAGFPGLPIQLLLPTLTVTLAESQGKKASFLREVVRTLKLKTEIWPHRVETMPAARRFDLITLRAVEKMERAAEAAMLRIAGGGTLALLVTSEHGGTPIPGSKNRVMHFVTAESSTWNTRFAEEV